MGKREVIEFKGINIVSIIEEAIQQEGEFKLLVTGNSMSPTLKHERDYVYLKNIKNHTLKKGDIVFIRRETGEYVLHRVYKLLIESESFIMNGDCQEWTETVKNNQIIAYVSKIERKGKEISCDNVLYKLIISIWMKLRPYRYKMYCLREGLRSN